MPSTSKMMPWSVGLWWRLGLSGSRGAKRRGREGGGGSWERFDGMVVWWRMDGLTGMIRLGVGGRFRVRTDNVDLMKMSC